MFWNLTEYCFRAVCGRVHALYLARFFPMRALWAIQHGWKRPGE